MTNLDYLTSDGTAEAGEDYDRASGTLNFAKDDVEETFTIDIADDGLDEDDETFDVELSASDGAALASTRKVTISDDDDPPSVSLSPTRVAENGGRATFAATLSEESGRSENGDLLAALTSVMTDTRDVYFQFVRSGSAMSVMKASLSSLEAFMKLSIASLAFIMSAITSWRLNRALES